MDQSNEMELLGCFSSASKTVLQNGPNSILTIHLKEVNEIIQSEQPKLKRAIPLKFGSKMRKFFFMKTIPTKDGLLMMKPANSIHHDHGYKNEINK